MHALKTITTIVDAITRFDSLTTVSVNPILQTTIERLNKQGPDAFLIHVARHVRVRVIGLRPRPLQAALAA